MALELSAEKWLLATSTGRDRPRIKTITAGDDTALEAEIAAAKRHFELPDDAPVVSCYEAGRDGFWPHRLLERLGVVNRPIDAASMLVDRRARRAKTDRLDVRRLLADLLRYEAGDVDVWSVVEVPDEEDEDNRRGPRELERLKQEETQHRARIRSLLATQGPCADRDFQTALRSPESLRDWQGNPLFPQLASEIAREVKRLDLVRKHIREVESARDKALKGSQPLSGALAKVDLLAHLRGIGVDSASLLVMEFFAWRVFKNRRELTGAVGLGGTPYASGSMQREQGISKNGNRRVRSRVIELAWLWLRYQPDSDLTEWFRRKFGDGGKRGRRRGIVALARRLLIEIWHFVEHGVVPSGAVLKPAHTEAP
ncbi:MAG: IS110 family transposase [Deltaproteobacteria bacterium]|nr:IS110 family transposase [Deltaproteobacteria bacterium]